MQILEKDFRVGIIGIGLIGGSIGLALKEKQIGSSITGFDIDPKNLNKAKELKIIDSGTKNLRELVEKSNLVFVCVPPKKIPEVLKEISGYSSPDTLVTDVGSTKYEIMKSAEKIGKGKFRFIGGHPIAGTEKNGPEAALKGLFNGRSCILVKTEQSDIEALNTIEKIWTRMGSKVLIIDSVLHDKIFAGVSHLPHLVAYALVETLNRYRSEQDDIFSFSAGGLRDFTRVASSSAQMWSEVCMENSDNIIFFLKNYMNTCKDLLTMIENKEQTRLEQLFLRIRELKEKEIC